MNRFLTVALFGLVMPTAIAQDLPLTRATHAVIKFAPLSLIDPDATVQGAVEWPVGYRMAVQTELGYGSSNRPPGGSGPSPSTPNNHVAGKEVWRGRVEGRYYTSFFKTLTMATYVAIEGLYKQVNVAYLDTILSRGADPSFVYAPVTKYMFALHSKVGVQFPLSYDPNSLLSYVLIDLYGGIGIRHGRISGRSTATTALFQDARIYDRFQYYDYRPGDRFWRPSLTAGFKIGVSL